MSYTIEQFNQAVSIVRRAEEDIRTTTGMDVALQIIATKTIRLTPELIARLAAEEADISYEALISQCRMLRVRNPRFSAMMLTKKHLPAISLTQIGKVYGRDHTTVINALKSGKDLLDADEDFRDFYTRLKARIEQFKENPLP